MSIIVAAKKLIEHVDDTTQQYVLIDDDRVVALKKAMEIGEPECPDSIRGASELVLDVIAHIKAIDVGGVSLSWLRTTLINERKL